MSQRVAVIGAGMAGLACAQHCAAIGLAVSVFDKGRRPGGRLATRRAGGAVFDHGAQFATARDPAFAAFLARAEAAGLAAPWPAASATHTRWVGTPGMSALAQAAALPGIATERHVAWLHRDAAGWWLHHHAAAALAPGTVSPVGGTVAGPFDTVVLAIPAAQAHALLHGIGHRFALDLQPVAVAPTWTLMLAFDAAQPGAEFASLDAGPLAWVARGASRPGRAALPDAWVAHASPAWSRAHLEQPAEAVLPLLRAAFAEATGSVAPPAYAAVHRWRYAQTEVPLGAPCLWDPASRLAVCGDWCLGARVEQAFLSGHAAAASLAPASLAPASLASASLAPASLAPAGLAAASLAPAGLAPARLA